MKKIKLYIFHPYSRIGGADLSLSRLINNLDDINIYKLTNELNRQSLMVGYIDAFKLFSWVGFFSIPLIFLIKIKKVN